MANKEFIGKIFENYDQLRKILPAQNGGVVIIEEENGLRVKGEILTEQDGNYKRSLHLARVGTKMLNPGKVVEVIMV